MRDFHGENVTLRWLPGGLAKLLRMTALPCVPFSILPSLLIQPLASDFVPPKLWGNSFAKAATATSCYSEEIPSRDSSAAVSKFVVRMQRISA